MTITHKITSMIRSRRESLAYSQEYMGEMLGISQSTYAHLESGRHIISIDRFFRIAELLDLDVHQLIEQSLHAPIYSNADQLPSASAFAPETKEVYDLLVHELKNEIDFLRNLVKEK